MSVDLTVVLSSLDSQVRSGQIQQARQTLVQLKKTKIPREYLVPLAAIARRVREDKWGLSLLRPILRSSQPVNPPPTQEEWIIYASLLLKIDAIAEAKEILANPYLAEHPDILYYQALSHLAEWDYLQTSQLLKKYLKRKTINHYQRAIAQVNLASALLYIENLQEASVLLRELIKKCEENHWDLLLSNCFELSAQLLIKQKKFNKAEELLKNAEIKNAHHKQYSLYVEKWRVIVNLFRDPLLLQNAMALEQIRAKAIATSSWETLRDCDFYKGTLNQDPQLLTTIYYGTPFQSYKKRIEAIFKNNQWILKKEYQWVSPFHPGERWLDLQHGLEYKSGEDDSSFQKIMKPGRLHHRLLMTLVTDFYRPFTLGKIFSQVFPKEYFNPHSGPERVNQAIKKARICFKKYNIPLKIDVNNGLYQLQFTAPYSILIRKSKDSLPAAENHSHLYKVQLKSLFPYQQFSMKSAAQALSLSSSHTRIIINDLLTEGKIHKTGNGRSTLYCFQKIK